MQALYGMLVICYRNSLRPSVSLSG